MYLTYHISKTSRARDLKFGTQMRSGNTSKTHKVKSRKRVWHRSRDPHKFWRTPYKMRRARDLKFGIQMQSGNISKTAKKNQEKGRGLGHVTPEFLA